MANETTRVAQELILLCTSAGVSLRKTARVAGVAKGTVERYRRLFAAGFDIEMENRHRDQAGLDPIVAEEYMRGVLTAIRAEADGETDAVTAERNTAYRKEQIEAAIAEADDELAVLIAEQFRDDHFYVPSWSVSLDASYSEGSVGHDFITSDAPAERVWSDPTAEQALSE